MMLLKADCGQTLARRCDILCNINSLLGIWVNCHPPYLPLVQWTTTSSKKTVTQNNA